MCSRQCERASRVPVARGDWRRRRGSITVELPSRAVEIEPCFDRETRNLMFSKRFMDSFGMQHRALQNFVDAARQLLNEELDLEQRLLAWRHLNIAWGQYYKEVGDGDEACRHFTDACEAAGASISPAQHTAPNCVHFALGAHIGAPRTSADPDGYIPSMLNVALVGFIQRQSDGRNTCTMTTWYAELLSELGFARADEPNVGSVVVYTIVKPVADGRSDEYAVHFGRVVTADRHGDVQSPMVESKSGYAFHTYVHPLNVVDPTYLIQAPCMRVHFFRERSGPLAPHALWDVARRYEERLRTLGYGAR